MTLSPFWSEDRRDTWQVTSHKLLCNWKTADGCSTRSLFIILFFFFLLSFKWKGCTVGVACCNLQHHTHYIDLNVNLCTFFVHKKDTNDMIPACKVASHDTYDTYQRYYPRTFQVRFSNWIFQIDKCRLKAPRGLTNIMQSTTGFKNETIKRMCRWLIQPEYSNRLLSSGLLLMLIRQKEMVCVESLHCVTMGEKKKERESGQGLREGTDGCVFADLVTAIEHPPCSNSALPQPPPSTISAWRVKGTFKQYRQPGMEIRQKQTEGANWRWAEGCNTIKGRPRQADKYIHNEVQDLHRDGKYLYTNRKSLQRLSAN